jgi:Zn finger protein HypA/HybF involved in hydrogenase expression
MIQNKDGHFICEKCGEVLSLNFTHDACYCKQCKENGNKDDYKKGELYL